MKILIDNGHGENTPGKRSPDGSLREYAYAREIADRIAHELSARGYDAERIVRETVDVPLSERARRVNEVCGRYGTANVVLDLERLTQQHIDTQLEYAIDFLHGKK